ncbi:8442_t:CDS:1, partial [Ambispora leptoticha]
EEELETITARRRKRVLNLNPNTGPNFNNIEAEIKVEEERNQ